MHPNNRDTARAPLPPINFKALGDALLDKARQLLPMWLPDGKFNGSEYTAHSVWRAEKTASLSVSISGQNAGQWADFGGDHRGGDLVSLYAAIYGTDNAKAAIDLANQYSLQAIAGIVAGAKAEGMGAKPPAPLPTLAAAKPRPSEEGWRTMMPVPEFAPKPTFVHHARSPDAIQHIAAYQIGEQTYGYVVRFQTSDGGKDTLPYTWCVSAKDGGARWHWRQFDEPRPLYMPGQQLPIDGQTVVLVEGEKKAQVLQQSLDQAAPGVYVVATWAGGCKAWKKADWSWLHACTVICWPDCDGKREPLTTEEKNQTPNKADQLALQATKPLLPENKQAGWLAMQFIGQHIKANHGCSVQVLPIPAPGQVVDGWDCADAITTDGWAPEQVLAFLATANSLPDAPDGHDSQAKQTPEPPSDAPAGAAPSSDDPFQQHIEFICAQQKCQPWDLQINRKLIISALRKSPDLVGVLGYNELVGTPYTQRPWPWRDKAGAMADSDDLRLGDWLSAQYKLKAASRAALFESIESVCDENRFHPIRGWLQGLQWDGKPRLHKWLMHVLSMNPEAVPERRQTYYGLVGKFLLMGLVARVMTPGCKFDYSPVFEGIAGVGKSTFVRTLVGDDFFSDTHFDIGSGKEGMEQMSGIWAYELSEMTAFKRADSEQVKQFFSSQKDRYRGAYGRFVQDHPRQCVIFCTTNKRQYLYDLTGNRRFWPIWIDQAIKIEWLIKYREQLFAEAFAAFTAGERYTPTREEEDVYFIPEQKSRLVETTVQSRLYELLTRDGSNQNEPNTSRDVTALTGFVTLHQLVAALGADPAKATSLLEGQIRGWLESHAWTYVRETKGQRRRGYKQPEQWPPKIDDDDTDAKPSAGSASTGEGDDVPF